MLEEESLNKKPRGGRNLKKIVVGTNENKVGRLIIFWGLMW